MATAIQDFYPSVSGSSTTGEKAAISPRFAGRVISAKCYAKTVGTGTLSFDVRINGVSVFASTPTLSAGSGTSSTFAADSSLDDFAAGARISVHIVSTAGTPPQDVTFQIKLEFDAAEVFVTQSANSVYAGPTSGGAAVPDFRAMVAADIPTLTSSKISDFSESVDDRVAALLVAGTGITLTYNDGAGTLTIDSAGGAAAPTDATYIVQTPNGTLSAEQALSALATGLVKVTTGTGVLSTAAAADLPTGIDAAKIADGSISNTEFQYLNGLTGTIQTQLDAKVSLQGSSPGTPDTGNSNISGTGIFGKIAAGISSPTFTGSNKLLVGATPNTAFGTAEVVFVPSSTTNTGLLVQGPASFTGNYLETQNSSGQKTLSVGVLGNSTQILFYNSGTNTGQLYANNSEAYFGSVANVPLYLGTNNSFQWFVTTGGHLVPYTSATRDLATSSTKVRNGYFSGELWTGKTSAGITTPSFGTKNKALFGNNPLNANNDAIAISTGAALTDYPYLAQPSGDGASVLYRGDAYHGGPAVEAGVNSARVGEFKIYYASTVYATFGWDTHPMVRAGSGLQLALGSNAATQLLLDTGGNLTPLTTNSRDLGTASLNFRNVFSLATTVPPTPVTLAAAATSIDATNRGFILLTGDGGTNTITSITGGVSGQLLEIQFVDGLVTISDAGTLKLSAGMTGSADDVLILRFDGTNWVERGRSVN